MFGSRLYIFGCLSTLFAFFLQFFSVQESFFKALCQIEVSAEPFVKPITSCIKLNMQMQISHATSFLSLSLSLPLSFSLSHTHIHTHTHTHLLSPCLLSFSLSQTQTHSIYIILFSQAHSLVYKNTQ